MKRILAVALSFLIVLGGVAWLNRSPAQATDATSATTYQLTGLPAENTAWRPVAVSVNSAAARTLGASQASVMYEVLAQGQQTNASLLFNNMWEMQMTGPVAPSSDILWQLAMPQNAVLIQNGWNLYSENLLNCYAYQPIDAMVEGVTAFTYDNGGNPLLAGEYCWYTTNVPAYQALESYGILAEGESTPLFHFGENKTAKEGATSLWLQYSATSGNFFSYDQATTKWMVSTAANGEWIDGNTQQQVGFNNVFVLFADASVKDDGYTREYDLTEGSGIYLTNGTWQPITWKKGDVINHVQVFNAKGKELVVNTGTSYIGVYGGFSGQMLSLTADSATYDAAALWN